MTPAAAAAAGAGLATVAWAAGWFTGPAAITGGIIAGVVFASAGPGGLAPLALFVVSGSLLGRPHPTSGRRRRAVQVIANGWTTALGAALMPLNAATGWAVLVGGLAAAQADTWATEIGLRSARQPVLLTTRVPVPPGTSGGITPLGTSAGVVGAAALGGVAGVIGHDFRLGAAAAIAGVAGMLADSWLGAGFQAAYRCAACGVPCERPRHCDVPAHLVSGHRWLDNDAVNAVATGAGAALTVAAVTLW